MNSKSFDPQAFSREIPKIDGPAPVHLWDPPFCGDIDMRIARDGTWHYQGSPIHREAMVRLFSSVLRRDGADHFLVTPVEKLGIIVEDCPFVAVALEEDDSVQPSVLRFTLNNGEQVPLDGDHVLRVEEDDLGQPHPVLPVRAGLEALVSRPVFYELVERAGEQPDGSGRSQLVLQSAGRSFSLGTC
jgi:hypothetical protein